MDKCPICNRELGTTRINKHHLVPKARGGKETSYMHEICHQKIHSVFTERELEKEFNIIENITSHPEMIKFIKWIRKKPIDYYDSHWDTNSRNSQRKYIKG